MVVSSLTLIILEERLAVCQLDKQADLPDWALNSSFFCITRSDEELSVICYEKDVPPDIKVEKGWRTFKVSGPLDFSQTGIVASLANPLALSGIPIFALSTYNTDYLLVKEEHLDKAKGVLGSFCRIED